MLYTVNHFCSGQTPSETGATVRKAASVAQQAGGRPLMSYRFDTFREVILNDYIPSIERNFRTLTNGQNRAKSGLYTSLHNSCSYSINLKENLK
jgi:hypothetical protein